MKMKHNHFYLTRDGKIVQVKKSQKNHGTNYIFEDDNCNSYLESGHMLSAFIEIDGDLISEINETTELEA